MGLRDIKLAWVIASLAVAVGSVGSYVFGQVFPVVHIATFVSGALLIYLIANNGIGKSKLYGVAVSSILLGLWFRTYQYLYPETFIGKDPGRFAVESYLVIQTASIQNISLPFYQDSPLFIISNSLVSLILGVDVPSAMAITPILVSIILPLSAWSLLNRCYPDSNNKARGYVLIISSVATFPTLYSIIPIAQTLSSMYVLLFVMIFSLRSQKVVMNSLYLTGLLMLLAMVFTHKLPVLITSMSLITYMALTIIQNSDTISSKSLWNTIAILIILLPIQWVLLTDFGSDVVLLLIEGFTDTSQGAVKPTAATSVTSGLFSMVLRNVNVFTVYPLAAILWLYHLKIGNEYNKILSSVTAATVGFGVMSYFAGVTTGVARAFLYTGTVISTLIIGGLSLNSDLWSKKSLIILLLISILGFQVFPLILAPDGSNLPRKYLTGGEAEAKEFELEHKPDSEVMDFYLSNMVVDPKYGKSQYLNYYDTNIDNILYNNTLKGNETAILRTNTKTFEFRIGWYKLMYNAEYKFDVEYDKVYANGHANSYT